VCGLSFWTSFGHPPAPMRFLFLFHVFRSMTTRRWVLGDCSPQQERPRLSPVLWASDSLRRAPRPRYSFPLSFLFPTSLEFAATVSLFLARTTFVITVAPFFLFLFPFSHAVRKGPFFKPSVGGSSPGRAESRKERILLSLSVTPAQVILRPGPCFLSRRDVLSPRRHSNERIHPLFFFFEPEGHEELF